MEPTGAKASSSPQARTPRPADQKEVSEIERLGSLLRPPVALAGNSNGRAVLLNGKGFFLRFTRREPGGRIEQYGPNVLHRGAITLFWSRKPTSQLRRTVETCTFG